MAPRIRWSSVRRHGIRESGSHLGESRCAPGRATRYSLFWPRDSSRGQVQNVVLRNRAETI
jgi:hypothetical protein